MLSRLVMLLLLGSGIMGRTMRNWVFLKPLFWKVLFFGLVADWGSKLVISLFINPIQFPRPAISELAGKVYPFPPGLFSIAHYEHWRDNWYDLHGLFQHIYNLIERITLFEVSASAFFLFLLLLLGIPFLLSLSSIRGQRPNIPLSISLGFWIAAILGNTGELWLNGHVTDWIWIRFGSLSVFTNLADLMAYVAMPLLIFGICVSDKDKKAKAQPEPDKT